MYERAINILMDYTPTEIAIFLAVVYEASANQRGRLKVDELIEREFILDIFKKVPDYPKDRFSYLVSNIEGNDDETDILKEKDVDRDRKQKVEIVDRKRDMETRFAEAVDSLDGSLLSFDGESQEVVIDLNYAMPIQAIILENMVRFDYSDDQLLPEFCTVFTIFRARNFLHG